MIGRGIGAGLAKLAKRQRPEGLRLWTFVSNAGTRRFYERHGFVETHRTDGPGQRGGFTGHPSTSGAARASGVDLTAANSAAPSTRR